MSKNIESCGQLPVPIAEMVPWSFWASPRGLGLSSEDAEAITNGTANYDQEQRARQVASAACHALIMAPFNQEILGRPS